MIQTVWKQGGLDGVPHESIGMSNRENHRDYLTHWSRSDVVHKTDVRTQGVGVLIHCKNIRLWTRETREIETLQDDPGSLDIAHVMLVS